MKLFADIARPLDRTQFSVPVSDREAIHAPLLSDDELKSVFVLQTFECFAIAKSVFGFAIDALDDAFHLEALLMIDPNHVFIFIVHLEFLIVFTE